MKRFLLHTLLTITALSGGSIHAQECLNGWCKAGCSQSGECIFVKVLSKNYPYVIYQHTNPAGMIKKQADFQQYKSRYFFSDGTKDPWKPAMPGTIGAAEIKTVCGM